MFLLIGIAVRFKFFSKILVSVVDFFRFRFSNFTNFWAHCTDLIGVVLGNHPTIGRFNDGEIPRLLKGEP